MEELKELKRRLEEERPASWNELPDIALYMDQVISYLPRQRIHFNEKENMTSAMVNNYIKDGLLPRADGKRYNRAHLGYLTAIAALKQVLSVREMATLIQDGEEGVEVTRLYEVFQEELDGALKDTAARIDPEIGEEELARLAFSLALRSYADRLACQRIIELLDPETDGRKKRKEKRGIR